MKMYLKVFDNDATVFQFRLDQQWDNYDFVGYWVAHGERGCWEHVDHKILNRMIKRWGEKS